MSVAGSKVRWLDTEGFFTALPEAPFRLDRPLVY
jgi:hypothetical protein